MPIQVSADWDDEEDDYDDTTITNVGLGGLAFLSPRPLEVLQRVRVSIPVLDRDHHVVGNVVWCESSGQGYEVGIEFEKTRDAFRVRMVEQICHIEDYRRQVERQDGRKLDSRQAAEEWIARFAGEFPKL